jgi:hypothetical protein
MLEAYLDGMSQLLTDKERPLHRAELGDYLSTMARARTTTVLQRLNGERRGSVVQFLYESGLIAMRRPVFGLKGANLRRAFLIRADLSGANLSGADLSGADLSGADLSGGVALRAARRWTEEQLRTARSLEGATMPNSQKYEDWIKDKEGHKDDTSPK